VAAAQLESDDAPERQTGHVRTTKTKRGHEPGDAVGVAGDPEGLRRVRGSSRTRRVPCDHRELVGEGLQLPPPRRRAVTDVAVQQHHGWPLTDTLVRHIDSVDRNDVQHQGSR
jgi:hypothetical protein